MNYDEFREDYEHKHPASIPKLEYQLSPYPSWLKKVVLVMFITAASGSGVHTIPTVYAGMPDYWPELIRHMASIASFTYIELAIFVAIFALIGSFSWLTVGITSLAAAVATIANVYSVANAYKGGDVWAFVISIALGIVAPGVALMSGKMFVNMHRADRLIKAQGDAKYREDCIAWDRRIELAHKAHEKSVSPEFSRDFMKKSREKKGRVKLHEVAREVHENGDANMKAEDMMEKYGISLGSTTKIREILNGNGSMNGSH